jgi:small-conductance mechanosensitive channel
MKTKYTIHEGFRTINLKFQKSGENRRVFFWTMKTFQVEFTKSDIRFEIYAKLEEHGIRIPFPQRDVHIIPPKD